MPARQPPARRPSVDLTRCVGSGRNAVHPETRLLSVADRARRRCVGCLNLQEYRSGADNHSKASRASRGLNPLSDPQADNEPLSSATAEFTALSAVLSDVKSACEALPEAEQQRYRSAQESVVQARRSAETHEGLLQVC